MLSAIPIPRSESSVTAGVTALAFSFARITAAESELITAHFAGGNPLASQPSSRPRLELREPGRKRGDLGGEPAGGLQRQPGRVDRKLDAARQLRVRASDELVEASG